MLVAAERGRGIIPAALEDVAAITDIQNASLLETKLAAGLDQRTIERGGFLVHALGVEKIEEMVTDSAIISRVHVDEAGAVDAYAFLYPMDHWKAQNPGWCDTIIMKPNAPPTPKDEKSVLFRYVAASPDAAPGVGAHMNSALLALCQGLGYKAVFGENLLAPYYNRAAHVVNTRRLGYEDVGEIRERYQGIDYHWTYVRKSLDA